LKKVLLIFADSSVKKGLADAEKLQSLLQSTADAAGLPMTFYVAYARSLSFLVTNRTSRIYDHRNKQDLKDYDFVYFRKAGTVMQQMLACASYLRQHQVPFYDREIGVASSRNKLSQMFLLHERGISVPPTLFCRHRQRLVRLVTVTYKDHFTWPVVAKATGGTRGDANYLVKTPEQLAELVRDVKRHFLVQSFIPNDGDYRALVVDGSLRGLIKRMGEEGSHLNNTSKNGSAEWLPLSDFDRPLRLLAIRAARACHRDIAGVDVLVNKETGEPYVLEVNRAPQIENASFPEKKADVLVRGLFEAMTLHIADSSTGAQSTRTVGRLERVAIQELPSLGTLTAKVDTGAYSNTLHCDYIEEIVDDRGIRMLAFSPDGSLGKALRTQEYTLKRIISSNGHAEERFIVVLHVLWGGNVLKGQFSLTDRSNMLHPMLIGRKFLKQHKLLVDVTRRFNA
jgi:glutathione synthase/RimK-type ligase-like ATP-grasp enzyme